VKHPEARVNTQPHIAIWTFKSYPGLFFAEYTTPHSFEASNHYLAMSSGSLVTLAWCFLRLWMEEKASRYGRQLKIY
jgi:hypothetical protein